MADELSGSAVLARLAFWAGALLTAAMITGRLVVGDPTALALLPMFPAGLFWAAQSSVALLAGWVVYVGLAVFLVVASSGRQFAIGSVVLCLCLAANVAGCYHMVDDVRL